MFFNENKKSPILQVFMNSQFLCNSDKYSLLFRSDADASTIQDMMMQSITVESEHLEERFKTNRELTTPSKKRELISNQYIQDIYRFFKLHPRKSDFVDPFHTQESFTTSPSSTKL
jgi:hypothetical protein